MASSAIAASLVPPAYATGQQRNVAVRAAVYMIALGVFFFLSYGLANQITGLHRHVPSVVFGWERSIPCLPWSIVPYWSLDVFYCGSFFICRTRGELDRHAHRLLATQIISVGCFALFPLRFAFERPAIPGVFGQLFGVLGEFDGPFNQAPSLHLSLVLILAARYSAHLPMPARRLLQAWFVLIGVSALTTYQHHFVDIVTGVWVGLFCCAVFPAQAAGDARDYPRKFQRTPARKLSTLYASCFLLVAFVAIRVGGAALWLLWPAGSCLIVSGIYFIGDPRLFRKQNGSLQPAMQCLLLPYTLAAWANSRWWTRDDSQAVEMADGVWLGRLPGLAERNNCGIHSLVDLTAELPVSTAHIEYRNVPMLDLAVPTASQLDDAVNAIEALKEHRPTLVCCALGYQRSARVVACWLIKTGRANDMEHAIATIGRKKRIELPASPAIPRESIAMSVSRKAVTGALIGAARIVTGAEARWTGCKPSEAPRVYVVNHTSHADFLLVLAALNPHLRSRTLPVGAAEYWNRNAVRRYLATHVFRAVLIERDRIDHMHNPLATMLKALDGGNSLIVFPEGTRGSGRTLQPFKCGIYHLAKARPNVELIPVWIDNLYRVLPRGAIVPAPILCSATFGSATRLSPDEDKQTFLARLQETVRQTGAACVVHH